MIRLVTRIQREVAKITVIVTMKRHKHADNDDNKHDNSNDCYNEALSMFCW